MSQERKATKKQARTWKKLREIFTLAWSISPIYIILVAANALISAAQILANVILPKFLIDELTGGKETKWLLVWGLAIVGCNLFFGFLADRRAHV